MPTLKLSDDPALAAAALCKRLLPLARQLVDNLPVEERAKFRQALTSETLFELQNTLTWLTSERVLGMAIESGHKSRKTSV